MFLGRTLLWKRREKDARVFPFSHVRTQQQGAIRKPGRESHKKLVKYQLVPWFWTSWSPELWEIDFCVSSHPTCGILLQQLEQIGTIPTEFLQRISKLSRGNRRAKPAITHHAVCLERLHSLVKVGHVSGSDPHMALKMESASLSVYCTILTSECSADNTQLPQKVSCPFGGSEVKKKKLLFKGSSKIVYIITVAEVIQEKLL